MSIYQKTEARREQILDAGCDLAEKHHYRQIRRHHLAEACETATGNISRVMGPMESFRDQLIAYAIENERNAVVVQAIVDNHPATQGITPTARKRFLAAVQ